jgi:hypothetical protein
MTNLPYNIHCQHYTNGGAIAYNTPIWYLHDLIIHFGDYDSVLNHNAMLK